MDPTTRILVVEDDPTVRLNLSAYLEDDGYDVTTVGDSGEAIEAARTDTDLSVAIVDVRLPSGTGDDLIRTLHEIRPSLGFLIHTGSVRYELSEELRSIGMEPGDVLQKPQVDMTTISRAVARIIARKARGS